MNGLALMPFGPEFANVYDAMKRACKKYSELKGTPVEIDRVDEHVGSFDIVQRLIELIRNASFCIADISGNNENVLWELGFADALDKPVIILTQSRDKVKFDLSHRRNVKYASTDMKDLEDELVKEITEMIAKMPDPSALPKHSSHARALAMSTASPTYFLGVDWKIKYMNEAALAMFASGPVRTNWVGRNIRELMTSRAPDLVNICAIEKNYQIQKQHNQILIDSGRENEVWPFDFEPIILNSTEYGQLELQKTAVAVLEPASTCILGWVVSFNVVHASEPKKYADFHERHRTAIETRLFPYDRPAPPSGSFTIKTERLEEALSEWIEDGCQNARLELAATYEDKQTCFEFAAKIMKTKRYGLKSLEKLPEWFFDFQNSEYVKLLSPENTLVGVGRIHPGHDMRQYKDTKKYKEKALDDWVYDLVEHDGTFADAGAYLLPEIVEQTRRDCLALLVGYAMHVCETKSNSSIYVQVPTDLIATFESFTFLKAGLPFECEGWRHTWMPMILKCGAFREEPQIIQDGVDGEFLKLATKSYKFARNNEI